MQSILKYFITSLFLLIILPSTNPAIADSPLGSVYLDGGDNKFALILCHGRGKHPKWKVVNPLRKSVHKRLGWHTLSLQMPASDKKFSAYADDFPKAYQTIKQAISFLKKEKGVQKIYLMGHSMGSRMASAFVATHPEQAVNGLIVAGIRNSGHPPLDGKQNLKKIKIPVLDIWGDGGDKDRNSAYDREELISDIYKQVTIADANHKFRGHEKKFVAEVIKWLQKNN